MFIGSKETTKFLPGMGAAMTRFARIGRYPVLQLRLSGVYTV